MSQGKKLFWSGGSLELTLSVKVMSGHIIIFKSLSILFHIIGLMVERLRKTKTLQSNINNKISWHAGSLSLMSLGKCLLNPPILTIRFHNGLKPSQVFVHHQPPQSTNKGCFIANQGNLCKPFIFNVAETNYWQELYRPSRADTFTVKKKQSNNQFRDSSFLLDLISFVYQIHQYIKILVLWCMVYSSYNGWVE